MKRNNQHKTRGSILIISIWILVIFGMLAAAFYKITSAQINTARALEERMLSQAAAQAACFYAQLERKLDETASYDSLLEFMPAIEKKLGRAAFKFTISDEESKININTVSSDILSELPGLDQNLAKKITESPLKPFKAKEEILLVEDINKEVFDQFRDFITIYGAGKTNINTASLPVLTAIGLDENLAQKILYYRLGYDGKENTDDDGVFENTAGIITALAPLAGALSQAEEQKLTQLISSGLIDVKSENLCLILETTIAEKPAMNYRIILSGDDIKEWREL